MAPATLMKKRKPKTAFRKDDSGFITLGPVVSLVGAVLVTVVVLLVINALAPQYITAVADLTSTIASSDWNNTIANAIADVVAILVPLAGLFALIGLIFAAFEGARRGLSGGGNGY